MTCERCEGLDRRLQDLHEGVRLAIKEIDMMLENLEEGNTKEELRSTRLMLGERAMKVYR